MSVEAESQSDVGGRGVVDVHERWEELLTVALLGTDRRDPPHGDSAIDDLVADCQRSTAAGRMLAQTAACVAVRRAAMAPAPSVPTLPSAEADERPPCPPSAVARWKHVVAAWPVLEDEWMLAAARRGWRLAPEIVPALLLRHRRDPVRLAQVAAGAGPVASWLIDVDEDLAGALGGGAAALISAVQSPPLDLPSLPIPDDLDALRAEEPTVVGEALQLGLRSGALTAPHRPVLVNLIARLPVDSLTSVIDALDSIDPFEPCAAIASSLTDLARTRRIMLDELEPPA